MPHVSSRPALRRFFNQRRVFNVALAAAIASTASASLHAGVGVAVSSNYTGPLAGNWSDAANWTNTPVMAQYPNNGNGGGFFYDATIANEATVTLTENISIEHFTLTNSTIEGDFNLTANGGMTWTGGGMRGEGVTTIPAGRTLEMSGGARRTLTRTLDNFGTTNWTNGGVTGDAFAALGTFTNRAGATFLANSSFVAMGAFGNGTFNNAGLVRKTAGLEARFGQVTKINNTGTIQVETGLIRFVGPITQLNAGTLSAGTWRVDATTAVGGEAFLQFDSSVVNVIGPAARVELIGSGAVFVNIDSLNENQGNFRIAGGRNFATPGALANSGTIEVGTGTAIDITGALTNTGTIDVNGGLLARYTTGSPLPAIESQIALARNGGAWNQAGITSSNARAAVPKNKNLGTMEGVQFQQLYGAGALFNGIAVNNSTVVVKYTYNGDTDLNGIVDFDDYSRTDGGFNNNRTGWLNGDFDYNGIVDFDDYSLIDQAFNTQSGTLRRAMSYLDGSDRSDNGMNVPALELVQQHFARFGDVYASSFLNSVPEPTSALVLLGGLAASAAGRRRRR
ncbi:MAG: PEP-CTERM sorting domain-containing protein [Anaerolineae bacterium]|nr:PEP-CTERM sorting domain-containing protein [Phycisphaerae bacterium]